MFKALKTAASPYTLFHIFASPIAAVVLPIYMIFGGHANLMSLLAMLSIFPFFMSYTMMHSVMPVMGPTPSEKKTMKWAENNRNMFNGSASSYDMSCVLPTTRKQLIKPLLTVWFIQLGIITAEIIAAVLLNYSSFGGEISVFCLCFSVMAVAVPNVMYYRVRNQHIGAFLMLIAYIVLMVVMIVSSILKYPITIALPSYLAILLPIAAIIFNIIFFHKTALKGDFARNGEKVTQPLR